MAAPRGRSASLRAKDFSPETNSAMATPAAMPDFLNGGSSRAAKA
jgi:hypothetical protein